MTAADPRAPAAAGRTLAVGVLAALLIGACGLPLSSTLQPPMEGRESEPGVMRFRGTARGINFLGYEIYYKLITSGETTPDPRHHDDLRAGFGRLSKADSGSCDGDRSPLVSVDTGTEDHWVSLDVSAFRAAATGQDASEPVLRFSWQQEQGQEVRRGIRDDDDSLRACRRFSTIDGYRPGDRDLSTAAAAAITARTGALIDLVAYAVSYGRDRGLPLYSAPLWIGRERLDLY